MDKELTTTTINPISNSFTAFGFAKMRVTALPVIEFGFPLVWICVLVDGIIADSFVSAGFAGVCIGVSVLTSHF